MLCIHQAPAEISATIVSPSFITGMLSQRKHDAVCLHAIVEVVKEHDVASAPGSYKRGPQPCLLLWGCQPFDGRVLAKLIGTP